MPEIIPKTADRGYWFRKPYILALFSIFIGIIINLIIFYVQLGVVMILFPIIATIWLVKLINKENWRSWSISLVLITSSLLYLFIMISKIVSGELFGGVDSGEAFLFGIILFIIPLLIWLVTCFVSLFYLIKDIKKYFK